MIEKNRIETERLILCEIDEQDTELIVSWRSKPEVYKYFRATHKLTSEEHVKWYNEEYLHDYAQLHWMAKDKALETPIGVFSIRKYQKFDDCVEVSYLVDGKEQGKGYAKEAVLGMLEYAAREWKANKSIAEIHEENLASRRMIEKLGFELVDRKDCFLIYERSLCCT